MKFRRSKTGNDPYRYDVKKKLFLLSFLFLDFAKYLNHPNLEDYKPFHCRVQKKSKPKYARNHSISEAYRSIPNFPLFINSFENLSKRLLLALRNFPGTVVYPLLNKLSEIIP